jgi:hypothetical protein
VTPRKNNKLAFVRRNTKQNPDGKLITPVNNPEKNLKTKYLSEPSTSRSPLFDTQDPMTNCSEVRGEIHKTFPSIHKGKGPLEISLSFHTPVFLRQKFPVSPDSEKSVTNSFSTPDSMAGVVGGGGGAPGGGTPRRRRWRSSKCPSSQSIRKGSSEICSPGFSHPPS